MTHTTDYTQLIDDCDFPVEAKWEIEYVAHRGYGDDVELEITGKHLEHVWLYLAGKQCFEVNIHENHKDAVFCLAAKLDDNDLLTACENHWDRRGYDEELEAA